MATARLVIGAFAAADEEMPEPFVADTQPDLAVEVACSPGTYVRVLASDLGARLGCGGHLIGLDVGRGDAVGDVLLHVQDAQHPLSGRNRHGGFGFCLGQQGMDQPVLMVDEV